MTHSSPPPPLPSPYSPSPLSLPPSLPPSDDAGNQIDSSLRLLSMAVEVTGEHIVRPKAPPLPPTAHHQTIQEVAKSEIDQRDLDSILEAGLVYLLLAHYRNQLLYLFVPEAMTALSLRANLPCDRGRLPQLL